MPKWADEKTWRKAKLAFMKEYGHKPKRKRDWKIVMSIYEGMIK